MKLVICFVFFACLQARANGVTQKIRLDENKLSLEKVLKKIGHQTGYTFLYESKVLRKASPVTLKVNGASLDQVLALCFKDQPLTYKIFGHTVVIKEKEKLILYAPGKSETEEAEFNIPIANIVTGRVTNAKGEPLVGVSVLVKGAATGTSTDENGNYSIDVPADGVLVFSYVGFTTAEISVAGRSSVNVELEESVSALDQIVVVGYGTQKERNVISSISQLKNDGIDQAPNAMAGNALAGRLSGVSITNTSNLPGAAPNIRVRGIGSINAGNNPLVVIDGFPGGDLNTLNMSDVESIEVLKDAASTAIYGSRASGGVIIVTTKRGRNKKAEINVNVFNGASKAMLQDDWLMGKEWYDYLVKYQNREFAWNGGDTTLPLWGDPARPTAYQVSPETYQLPQTNWQDEVFHVAPFQNYNISVNGGNEVAKYYISGNYLNEEGTLKTGGYYRYSVRSNLDINVSKRINLKFEINPSYSKRRIPGSNTLSLAKYPPFVPPYKINGKYPRTLDFIPFGHSSQASPYTFLYGTENYNKVLSNLMRGALNIEVLEGLTLNSSVGADMNFFNNDFWSGGIGDPQVQTQGHVSATNTINLVNENVLNYSKDIGSDHHIDAMAGASYQRARTESSQIYALGNSFNNEIIKTLNNALINPSSTTQSKTGWGLISYFGRLNYSFMDRYLVGGSIRTDGSSRFGQNHKWGTFPSVSAGWIISEENFLKNSSTINILKLRADYGETGNFNIGDFQYLGAVGSVQYSPNSATENGLAQTTISNPDLSWEKNVGFDIGIDASLIQNRFSISIDYYNRKTQGMLYNVNVPAITGFTDAIQNIGDISNKGFDLEISSANLVNDFKWNTTFNISHNQNEVLNLGQVDERIITTTYSNWLLRKGVPMFSYYGYHIIGVFQNQQEIDNTPHLAGTKPGNPIYMDVDGNKIIDDRDKMVLGNFMPKVILGLRNKFSWKNFDLDIFINGSLGAKIYNIEDQTYEGNTLGAMKKSLAERQWWSEDEPGDGKSPAAALSQLFGFNSNTDFYIENGSFIKLNNINLGYNMTKIVQRIGLKYAKVYISASNLILIKSKNYHGYNPEGVTGGEVSGINSTPGMNYGTEPLNRIIGLGLDVRF